MTFMFELNPHAIKNTLYPSFNRSGCTPLSEKIS